MDYSQVKVKDLKEMKLDELNDLASFIRSKIITTVSQNGGHLSSNLGMVELTIALHKVFDTPRDKIIFDVSHQTYAHKLLTDRAEKFSTLRKMNGISGFSKYSESLYDANTAKKLSNVMNASMLDCVTHEVITKEQVHDIESIFFKHIEYNFKHIKASHTSEEKK